MFGQIVFVLCTNLFRCVSGGFKSKMSYLCILMLPPIDASLMKMCARVDALVAPAQESNSAAKNYAYDNTIKGFAVFILTAVS